jgi:hypothetical protein
MRKIVNYGQADSQRVDEFFNRFKGSVLEAIKEKPIDELDKQIRDAKLSLADKIEVFRNLAPRRDKTFHWEELRMERLLRSVDLKDLPVFKAALEYDGDYKDVAEYVFHDIDDKKLQDRIIEYFRTSPQQIGIKVLSDVDDTMYANLIDERYPRKTSKKPSVYPGVLEFYDSLKREPFELEGIPVTTLSARPNPIAGILEEGSLNKLVEYSGGRLYPSALSGALLSSTAGTLETWLRANAHLLPNKVPHEQEDKIGEVKFENFVQFSKVYPEYRYVFVGDSGQADSLTAERMVTERSREGTSRVITTFIHDLRESKDDGRSASPTFRDLGPDVVVGKKSADGRGVIVFRNYIDAAVITYMHSATLENLVTVEGLARITKAALEQFREQKTDFQQAGKEESRQRLQQQYREDAEEACNLLMRVTPGSTAVEENVKAIRRMLGDDL